MTVSNDCRNIYEDEENGDDLFEFALPNKELDSSFMHKPSVFPVFNREIFDNLNEPNKNSKNWISTTSEESEDETPGLYSMWRRKSIGSSTPGSCKKSKSTGSISFKRFKIRDLLRRSNSDGTNSCTSATKSSNGKSPSHSVKSTDKTKASLPELFYTEKRSIKEGDKIKSYLPYRKDLIGLFSVFGRQT
ncbi:uncharacterized protein LOC141709067 [Apium graveolens]|uniref:uncharacterized protein LOC141709067 n=1 Tax=Apium graveolens TaxID=4045 RepID=UPI003D7AF572